MYPLHLWLPNALYVFAPSAVTAFLAATATKVADLRDPFAVRVFGVPTRLRFRRSYTLEVIILIPFALLAMFAASLIARSSRRDLKRLLAYSSLAQIGYMLLGITFLSETGLIGDDGPSFQSWHHQGGAVYGGGLLCDAGWAVGFIANSVAAVKPCPGPGCGRGSRPVFGGIPGTAGFISKWLLIEAALRSGVVDCGAIGRGLVVAGGDLCLASD